MLQCEDLKSRLVRYYMNKHLIISKIKFYMQLSSRLKETDTLNIVIEMISKYSTDS